INCSTKPTRKMLSRAASIKMKTARRPGWTENWPSINRWSANHCTLAQRRKDAKTHSETAPISAGFRGYFAPSRLCAFALSQVAGLLLAAGICAAPAPWQPTQAPLMTRWAKDVKPYDTLREYPRPQLVRDQWMNLNGLWDFAIGPKGGPKPATFPRQILVPFPAESALSGVMTKITEKDQLWYRRFLDIPSDWFGHILLHFGAVDFETTVWVNGQQVGQHRGGYDPFSFDITDKLRQGGGNDIVVSVWDPTDASPNSRGKQVRKPDQGIFYTATSGIWQTVWLEPVPVASIASVKVTPDVDGSRFLISVALRGAPADNFYLEATAVGEDGRQAGRVSGRAANELSLAIQNPRLWTPEAPFLYDLKIALRTQTSKFDEVRSYSGLRKVALGSDKGVTRIFLNNKPFFMLGPLDQGFWPDGLYTAPTDEALRSDIETTKQLGFNMARKHVKVEPDRWYYWCDKLGLLVWQDMPSGDKFISPTQPDITRAPESAMQFETELKALIQTHYNHPAIVM